MWAQHFELTRASKWEYLRFQRNFLPIAIWRRFLNLRLEQAAFFTLPSKKDQQRWSSSAQKLPTLLIQINICFTIFITSKYYNDPSGLVYIHFKFCIFRKVVDVALVESLRQGKMASSLSFSYSHPDPPFSGLIYICHRVPPGFCPEFFQVPILSVVNTNL